MTGAGGSDGGLVGGVSEATLVHGETIKGRAPPLSESHTWDNHGGSGIPTRSHCRCRLKPKGGPARKAGPPLGHESNTQHSIQLDVGVYEDCTDW